MGLLVMLHEPGTLELVAKLKQSVIERIYSALDNDYFTVGDVEVSFPPKKVTPLCEIKFRHNPQFTFVITEGRKGLEIMGDPVPYTIESPGDFKASETHEHNVYEQCLERVKPWCQNIRNDRRARIPLFDDFDELRAQFDKHIKEHLDDPDSPFTAEELERINKRFDELYAQIPALAAKHEVSEQELKEVRRQFDLMKQNASQYPKGTWANPTKTRLITALRKVAGSKEAKKLMYEGARKLLGWDGPST
jgi:hypothetical protein